MENHSHELQKLSGDVESPARVPERRQNHFRLGTFPVDESRNRSGISAGKPAATIRQDFVPRRIQVAFLWLIVAQAAHSTEEYLTRLYDVFAPARFVSSLVSPDPASGFLVVNAALVGFGLWCWAIPVRSGWPAARAVVWFWALLEFANGVGHLLLAVGQRGYFPGAATAPLLLALSSWLAALQSRGGRPETT